MSKSNEADLQRKEAIEKLLDEKSELLEKAHNAMGEYNDLREKIHVINDQIATLQALTSDIT